MSEAQVSQAQKGARFRRLEVGEAAPWFRQRTSNRPSFAFDTMGGRYVVLCFFGSAGDARARLALEAVRANASLFDDVRISLFGVTIDPADEAAGRVADAPPGVRYFLDYDASVSELYGAAPLDREAGVGQLVMRRQWVVLDPSLRVAAIVPFAPEGGETDRLMAYLRALPMPGLLLGGAEAFAPVLQLPDVFEPDLCRELIKYYEARGGQASGFMREIDGKTQVVHDPGHKRRKDVLIDEPGLIRETQARVQRRITPMIARAYQFHVSRMERYLIACYDSEDQGFFRPHRDNTTKGTAHRRFAVTINLNAEFEGGELRFPEYGPRTYRPAPGAAVIFSCGLLHEATPVVAGRRFAFLPFLYDEKAAQEREANNAFLGEGVGAYTATPSDA